jgi:hypothetical protein
MAADRIASIEALLVQAGEAHHDFEETELNGVYDQEWPHWYAVYAVEHGLDALAGHAITTDRLAQFFADSNVEFEAAKPIESWASYTARRITEEL